jgi:predicted MPP superfamily phosphohydrolase
MRRSSSRFSQFRRRLESHLLGNGWPVRLARRLGVRYRVRTVEHTVLLATRSGLVRPLRIAFASDFHTGPTTDPAVLVGACNALRAAAPDVLLLGGDFVGFEADAIDWLAPLLGSIPAPLGRFAVLGNHDRWTDADYIGRRLEDAGIQLLVNRNVRLAAPADGLWICGLDDDRHGRPDGAAALEGADAARIVLMHSPSGLLELGSQRFDLALCGHTHGGQIALPGGIPLLLPAGPLSRRYARGRFDLGEGRTLIVSVGLGCGGLPIRTFATPEILLCHVAEQALDISTTKS